MTAPTRTGPIFFLALLAFSFVFTGGTLEGIAEPVPDIPVGVDGGAEADHDALRALKDLYERAVRENDPALLKPHLDADFTGVMVTGEQVATLDSIDAYWQKIQKLLGEGGSYSVTVHVAEKSLISGDLAIAYGTNDDVAVTGRGKKYEFTSTWTVVCRKRAGQWRILRLQGTMDPVGNVFVKTAISSVRNITAVIAAIAGLLLGWLAHRALSRRGG